MPGSWLDARFAAARVPTLVAALDFCRTRGIWLNVEIKPVPGFERATGTVVARTVAAFQGGAAASPAQVLLSSFSRVALEAARAEAPGLPRGLLCTRVAPAWADMLAALDAVSLHCDHRPLSARTAAAVEGRGLRPGLLHRQCAGARRAACRLGGRRRLHRPHRHPGS